MGQKRDPSPFTRHCSLSVLSRETRCGGSDRQGMRDLNLGGPHVSHHRGRPQASHGCKPHSEIHVVHGEKSTVLKMDRRNAPSP
jgi:hypothetical protein